MKEPALGLLLSFSMSLVACSKSSPQPPPVEPSGTSANPAPIGAPGSGGSTSPAPGGAATPGTTAVPQATVASDGGSPKPSSPQIANPASQYCVDHGGRVDIRNAPDGQAGYCVFSNGSECDEWEYFRGQCAPKR